MQCFSFSALKASLIDSFIATVDQKLCNVRDVADRNDSEAQVSVAVPSIQLNF